jgi:hypothetical protein
MAVSRKGDRIVPYRVVADAVGAGGGNGNGAEGDSEKSCDGELHVCGDVFLLSELLWIGVGRQVLMMRIESTKEKSCEPLY